MQAGELLVKPYAFHCSSQRTNTVFSTRLRAFYSLGYRMELIQAFYHMSVHSLLEVRLNRRHQCFAIRARSGKRLLTPDLILQDRPARRGINAKPT